MRRTTDAIRIGVSGWRYPPWRGPFYPKGLPQRRELEFASRVFGSIELNGSFYSLQRPENYATWYRQTPPGFIFSVKAPRFITHIKRLRDIDAPMANFFASGLANLRFIWTARSLLLFRQHGQGRGASELAPARAEARCRVVSVAWADAAIRLNRPPD